MDMDGRALFGVTAATPDGRITSYRFHAADWATAEPRARALCAEAGNEFVRLKKLGAPVREMDRWT